MESLYSKINLEDIQKQPLNAFRSRRDELVDGFVHGINLERLKTKFKPITHKQVALRINANPLFTERDGEIELLLKTCKERKNFSKFFWVCPLPNKKTVS